MMHQGIEKICAVLIAAMVSVLTACDSGSTADSKAQPDRGVFVASTPPPELFLDAQYKGEVYVVNGCLYLGNEYVKDLILPVFPEGQAQWSNGALVFDGNEYVEGASIEVSGGESPRESEAEWARLFGVPKGCAVRNVWIVGLPQ